MYAETCGTPELSWVAEYVPHPAHGMDQAIFSLSFQLLAQVANIHLDDIALTTKVISPDTIKDHIASEHLAGVTQEEL